MSNTGLQIIATQNTDSSIRMLGAQSHLYSKAKTLFIWQTIIAVPIPILIAVFTTIFDTSADKILWIFSIYTALATFGEVVFEKAIATLKKTGASIQELFDTTVYGLAWNDVLLPTKPRNESVFSNFSEYEQKDNVQRLYDWYSPEVRELNTNLATLVCQRTNCSYDFSLRKRFSLFILIITAATFLILILIATGAGITLRSFFVQVVAPSVPVFVLAFKQYLSNKESISNLAELRNLIESNISNYNFHSSIDEKLLRQIQDKIYYNRILSPLLLDKIFKKNRNSLEKQMHFSVRDTVRELRSR